MPPKSGKVSTLAYCLESSQPSFTEGFLFFSSAVDIITEKLNNSPSLAEGSREPTEVFQRDFIRGVVSEAMQEWCDGVEKRMWGLQYSLLRQMQHHQV